MNIWLFFLCLALVLLALVTLAAWYGASNHNAGYKRGHDDGFHDGYLAGYQRAMQAKQEQYVS